MSTEASQATSFDELETPGQMRADCVEVSRNLRLERAARTVSEPAPSLHFADYPREVRKRDVPVSEAAARLAAALHLHLN